MKLDRSLPVLLALLVLGACGASDDEPRCEDAEHCASTACTQAPDCGGCQTCMEVCTCWGTAPDQCEQQCATRSAGGSGAVSGAGGSGSNGAGGTAGSSAGGQSAGGAGGAGGIGGSAGLGASAGAGGTSGAGGSSSGGDCCSPAFSPSCSDPAIAACVCAQDAYCCQYEWDKQCVAEIAIFGCGSCGGNCSLELPDPVCSACMQKSCCEQAEGCFHDSGCVNLAKCISKFCPSAGTLAEISSCIDTTCSLWAGAKPTMLGYLNCLSKKCSAQCGI